MFHALIRAALLIALLALAAPASAQATLRVCMTDMPHEPWRRADAQGRVNGEGLDFMLLRDFARHAGWKVELRMRPGRRCLLEIERGESDATVGLSHTEERARWARFPMRQGELDGNLALRLDGYNLYTRREDMPVWDPRTQRLRADLPAVLVQGGHSVAEWLRTQGHTVDERPRSVAQALRWLEDGSAELAALPRSEADALIARAEMNVRRLDPPLLIKPYFVVFSEVFARQHEAELPRLWQAFAKAARAPAYAAAAQRR